MNSNTIIDSRLWISHDLSRTVERNLAFQTNRANLGHLANQLILYDHIVIPTNDFGIVPILINWLGLEPFRVALESGSIAFLYRKDLLGYAGNGGGICTFTINPTSAKPFLWWQEALFGGKMDVAVELQLRNMCPFIPTNERLALTTATIEQTKPVQYDNDFFKQHVMHETYTDIMKDKNLSSFVTHLSGSTDPINLTRLPGLGPNQLKVSRPGSIKDAADLVLRVAEINMDFVLSTTYGDCDLFTCEGAEKILRSKLERSGAPKATLEGLIKLLDLNNIPDVGVGVTSGSISISEILKLREQPDARKFRQWLRNAKPEDARELEKLYVKSLGHSGVFQSLPLRLLRFAILTAIGLLNPGIGTTLSACDNFFVDKWLKGYSPKLFLDRLRKLVIKD